MNKLKENERIFWDRYVASSSLKVDPTELTVSSGPCGTFDITNSLIELYLAGKKSAASGLVEDYQSTGDPLPKAGDYWIVLDSRENPKIILKTISTEINKFKDLPLRIAIAEGEGDLSIDYWKKVHADLYKPFLKKWGVTHLDEAHIVTEHFEMLFT